MTGDSQPRGAATRSSVRSFDFESAALAGNALGDPTTRQVWVYLPPGYDADEDAYPVLFVLTGFTGRGRMALNDGAWSPPLDQRMDRLIAAGEAEPAILVLPDCFTRLGGSQYLNSTATGRYEDHVVDELVPWVDATFRTRGDGHRGVLGKSSGGYGALRLALRRPGVFHGVASHSGDLAFDLCYPADFPQAARTLAREGGIDGFLEKFAQGEKKTSEQVHVLAVLAMAAAYSPNPSAPHGFDLPFDVHDLTRRDDVWQRWLDNDPIVMLERRECQDALRGLDVLFLDAGTKDQYNLDFGARRFVKRLAELDIRHRYEEFEDDHFSVSYRYDRSLPLLSRTLQ